MGRKHLSSLGTKLTLPGFMVLIQDAVVWCSPQVRSRRTNRDGWQTATGRVME